MKRSQRNVFCAMIVALLFVGQLGAKNLILNGEFDEGLKNWTNGWVNTGGGVSVTFDVDSSGMLSGDYSWVHDIATGGGTDYYIQRVQNLPIVTGITYSLTFMGMMVGAGTEREITVCFENGSPDYHRYLTETIALTDVPTEFGPFDYTADTDDAAVQLKFFTGGSDDVQIYLDAIVVDDGEPETAVDSEDASLPSAFSLDQNYPNPFNPTTEIWYDTPSASHVTLTVFDLTGKTVATLVDGSQDAGSHSVTFDARNLSSGTYIYRLDAGNNSFTKKMMLIK